MLCFRIKSTAGVIDHAHITTDSLWESAELEASTKERLLKQKQKGGEKNRTASISKDNSGLGSNMCTGGPSDFFRKSSSDPPLALVSHILQIVCSATN